jgi:acyl-CoA thioesterase-1
VLTRAILYHLASGHSFFSGLACLIVAILLSCGELTKWSAAIRNVLLIVGGLLIVVSGTPLAQERVLLLGAIFLFWLSAEWQRRRLPAWVVRTARIAAAGACAGAVFFEAPYHVMPRIPAIGSPVLGVIGDSITAGMNEPGASTWPQILGSRQGVQVRDHARMGATVASAQEQAALIAPEERLVLMEIGGNDLLGGTPAKDYEVGLDRLLASVCLPGRVVVMLELPLPPGYQAFGFVQRKLARRRGVFLIPKRLLIGVLQARGATLDSIHLSAEGHTRMAQAVWSVLRNAYEDNGPR